MPRKFYCGVLYCSPRSFSAHPQGDIRLRCEALAQFQVGRRYCLVPHAPAPFLKTNLRSNQYLRTRGSFGTFPSYSTYSSPNLSLSSSSASAMCESTSVSTNEYTAPGTEPANSASPKAPMTPSIYSAHMTHLDVYSFFTAEIKYKTNQYL